MAIQIQFRRGTTAEWTAANPVLAVGELGLDTTLGYFKVGDGATAWNSLGYSNVPIPSQSGNNGKYLTTNGTTASWASVTTDPTPTVFMLMGA